MVDATDELLISSPTQVVSCKLSETEQWIATQRARWEARSDRIAEFFERHHAEEQADVTRTR
ncbi:hypothetical protein WL80_29340 [Burkholderia ubonensis]|uniref:hypothetical protein n=1 Tax=Burkholderia ubonensis TaxID=101571 RepID=UPI0007565B9C|nr:hypothetical protein [Burkholderia ubonensis]KVM60535.1 hypothetical protein WJ60_18835 [Burkholderia ubonensis]KVX83149.1 hypothetical protein WL08_01090 [Burkholderia ubonensis]KWF01762.1 hypothetical protein WL80_29340 [Burkholderia ubonensis]